MASLGGRVMKVAPAGLLAIVVVIASAGHAYAGRTSCDGLTNLTLEKATVTRAEVVPAGGFKAPGGGGNAQNAARFAQLPAFCRVAVTLQPSADSDIKIEVWRRQRSREPRSCRPADSRRQVAVA